MSIKGRCTLALAIVVSLWLGIFSLVIYAQVEKKLLAEDSARLRDRMEHEWNHILYHDGHPDEGPNTMPDADVSMIIRQDGLIIYDSYRGESQPGAIKQRWARDTHNVHFEFEGELNPRLTHAHLRVFRGIFFGGWLVSLILVLPLSWGFAGALLRPFRDLSQITEGLDARNLAFRFPETGASDEFGRLVRSFNALLSRLEKSFSQIRRFAVNASHELRTPITIIRGEAELTLRRPRTIEHYEEALKKIVGQSKNLQNVVGRLLLLSDFERMEQTVSEREMIPAKKVVEETLRVLRSSVASEAKVFSVLGNEVMYFGQPELFHSVVSNLIENALKYSRGEVRVQLSRQDDGLAILVDDDGSGIPLDQRREVFEPFFKARSERRVAGHGLGLSIVKACVDAAKGTIELSDSLLGGLKVKVFLPEATT